MFSAWAREIAQIKGVVSIVSPWIHLFLFCLFDLVFRLTTLHDTPPFVDLDHFYMLLYLPNSSEEELLHINF